MNALYRKVVRNLFEKNIRSREAYDAHAEETGPVLTAEGQKLLTLVIPVLESYQQTGKTLFHLEVKHRFNAAACDILSKLKRSLALLVPPNFPDLYDPDRLAHLPRYIKAIEIRAERAVIDAEKDRAKEAEAAPFEDRLKALLDSLTPATSNEKRTAVEAFFWMIEEYKVSLFAQELKTAVRISRKRLEKKLSEIERMV